MAVSARQADYITYPNTSKWFAVNDRAPYCYNHPIKDLLRFECDSHYSEFPNQLVCA